MVMFAAVALLCEIEPPPLLTMMSRFRPRSIAAVVVSLPPLLKAMLFPGAPPPRLVGFAMLIAPPPIFVGPKFSFGPTSVSVLAPVLVTPIGPNNWLPAVAVSV